MRRRRRRRRRGSESAALAANGEQRTFQGVVETPSLSPCATYQNSIVFVVFDSPYCKLVRPDAARAVSLSRWRWSSSRVDFLTLAMAALFASGWLCVERENNSRQKNRIGNKWPRVKQKWQEPGLYPWTARTVSGPGRSFLRRHIYGLLRVLHATTVPIRTGQAGVAATGHHEPRLTGTPTGGGFSPVASRVSGKGHAPAINPSLSLSAGHPGLAAAAAPSDGGGSLVRRPPCPCPLSR
jgi:hypothetical protein